MLEERRKLQKRITSVNKELAALPEGKIYCVQDGQRIKWYRKENGKESYISKKNRNLAEQLAYKKYLSLLLEEYSRELCAIDFYLRHHDRQKGKEVRELLSQPAYQELLSFVPVTDELTAWMQQPYERNRKHPENLIYKTASGNTVRSKSEVLIDMFLYTNRIPYRYECALVLGDITVYPDFTMRHPVTGKELYLEHFGMMDVPEYRKQAFAKMQLYSEHQIMPGQQLLMTFESKNCPLSPDIIEKTLGPHLLQ